MDIKRDLEVLKKYFTDHQKSVGIDRNFIRFYLGLQS